MVNAKQPWASGPGEILQHGINLLQKDSDVNRRLAMLSIDNAVELMIKTYLGLPKRVTGHSISRSEYSEISENFPKMLDALEKHIGERLEGIDLGEIEWYHRLRNELYHQGNGLTVERQKVVVYAELAQLLFQKLFKYSLQIEKTENQELIGEFVTKWARLEQLLEKLVKSSFPEWQSNFAWADMRVWHDIGTVTGAGDALGRELHHLRHLRNQVVHGKTKSLTKEEVNRLTVLLTKLERESRYAEVGRGDS